MTQPIRTKLAQLIAVMRPDWPEKQTHQACRDLSAKAGTPFGLVIHAVKAASVAANRSPDCIAASGPSAEIPKPRPKGPCPEHCGTTVNAAGQYVCCVQESSTW